MNKDTKEYTTVKRRQPGNLISDLVWGACTILDWAYTVYLAHYWLTQESSRAGWMALTFAFIALVLSTQAPVKR